MCINKKKLKNCDYLTIRAMNNLNSEMQNTYSVLEF